MRNQQLVYKAMNTYEPNLHFLYGDRQTSVHDSLPPVYHHFGNIAIYGRNILQSPISLYFHNMLLYNNSIFPCLAKYSHPDRKHFHTVLLHPFLSYLVRRSLDLYAVQKYMPTGLQHNQSDQLQDTFFLLFRYNTWQNPSYLTDHKDRSDVNRNLLQQGCL